MTTAPSCCTLAPVHQPYTSKGEVVKVGDLSIYVTGPKGAKNAIIFNYDIFGDHPNTRQVADLLATHNFRVAIPDLCYGDPWPASQWPPESIEKVFGHIGKVAPFDNVKRDIKETQKYLQSEGSEHFGLVGFCWGGRNVALLTEDASYEAGAIVHPGPVTPEQADKVQAPLLIMPAMDDDKAMFEKVYEILKTKSFGDRAVFKYFDDVPHGFCASRSDFTKELTAKRANEAIKEMHDFFVKNLGARL
ncbi:hypothetical protein HDU76_002419 [Blyttiomyces sp. JEL0837]|nr:hypothetical protein HDU76_002419 [Blyttiomyces sp. JEL0837]